MERIPAHWRTARLRYVARVGNGTTPARGRFDYWSNGTVPWLASGQVNDYIVRKARELVTAQAVKESCLRVLPAGSVILGMVGQGKTRGMSAYLAIDATINQNLAGITPGKELDGRYLHYMLTAAYDFQRNYGRGGNQAALNCAIVGSFPTLLPPRQEQDKIVAYLRAQDARISRLIKAKRELIGLLTEQKLRIIDHAVTRGLDDSVALKPSGIEWLGDVPLHWDIALVKHVADVRFSGVDKHSHDHETSVRLCNYTDVYKNDKITGDMDLMQATATAGEIARLTLKAGDVIITKDSETPDDIAVPAWVPVGLPGVVCAYHLGLLRPEPGRIEGEFLFRAIGSARIAEQFHVLATGVTRFALGKHDVKNAVIPLPPIGEQKVICRWIADECKPLEEAILRAEDEIKLIREYRDRQIADVVTGQVDVRGWVSGPDDVVADEDLAVLGSDDELDTDGEEEDGDD
ncbi:restriction endonuclease subunit S [Tahibacter aquaticus]|uniref:restriction endonuclease subunit S n=1 Tax=Tahibacter aquaticus TaxID=520092 RepID=UPI001AAD7769|nr:restriction endonuclease subunit S [Tahibacter aquaticus]